MHFNFALRKLLPLLSIGLNDTDVDTSASGGGEGVDGGTDAADTGKQAEGKTAADGTDAKAPDAKAKPPDAKADPAAALAKSYEGWQPKVPEGLPVDAKAFGEFQKLFIAEGIEPAKAQKLVDAFAKGELARMQEVASTIKAEQASWERAVRADKELAGEDGKQLEQSLVAGRRAMQKWATPELRALLKSSGLEAHPEMIRLMARAGATLKEDSTATSTTAGAGSKSLTPQQKLKARYNHPSSAELHTPNE